MDMATSLGCSAAFLSAIETGRKKISKEYITKIANYFSLDKHQLQELQNAADNSPVSVKMNLINSSCHDREIVAAFARKFSSLSEEEKNKIHNMFKDSRDV